jgi:hypothetical protein
MEWKYFRWLIYAALFIILMTKANSCSKTLSSDSPYQKFKAYIPGSYEAKLYDVANSRKKELVNFNETESNFDKAEMIVNARFDLMDLVEKELFPHWYDTKYDFNGTTQTPGKGKIACGYFVTTVLRDIGIPIKRIKMAQAASETMIKNLVDEDLIRRFRKVSIQKFVYDVENMGEGLYVVGLDTHAGFLFYDGVELRMIHSTGRRPKKVINEKAITSLSLIRSKYKVIGKVSDDEDLIKRWLYNYEP